ncbi:MAG: hypothetical protein EOM40_18945 [Clostridia bacterium]|nr:hypothetical protein [Clostridia bacterium]NCC43965.1 hypothetical protein [Clostridia bacterium]
MRWKNDVKIEKKNGYMLKNKEGERKIKPEDEYIVKAMVKGICEDERLLEVIKKKEDLDEILSGFRLAEFLVEYGEYIEELKDELMIEE